MAPKECDFHCCNDRKAESTPVVLKRRLPRWLRCVRHVAQACGRAVLALLALCLLGYLSARAQAQQRPADFKVSLVLLPSDLKNKSISEMQSFLQRARSDDLGLVRGPQVLIPLISVTEYKRGAQKINLTAECLAVGPDGKFIIDNRECGSATEGDFKPPDKVQLRYTQTLELKETSLPGPYVFGVIITDHVKGTEASAKKLFTYDPSGAPQTASATAPPAPAGQVAPPGFTTSGTGTLDGLYAGHYTQNHIHANWYLFKPSGTVAVDCNQALDPDEVLSWPNRTGPGLWRKLRDQGYQLFDCELGRYRLDGGTIRISAPCLLIDLTHRVTVRDPWYVCDDQKGEAHSFRFVDGPKQIEIGQRFGVQSLLRQVDQSGKKLSGDFGCSDVDFVANNSGKASFFPDGVFSMNEEGSAKYGSVYGSVEAFSSSARKGRYEIRGNEIIFHNSDGTTWKQLFGDLGKDDHGRERVAIGGSIWTKGLKGIWGL